MVLLLLYIPGCYFNCGAGRGVHCSDKHCTFFIQAGVMNIISCITRYTDRASNGSGPP